MKRIHPPYGIIQWEPQRQKRRSRTERSLLTLAAILLFVGGLVWHYLWP